MANQRVKRESVFDNGFLVAALTGAVLIMLSYVVLYSGSSAFNSLNIGFYFAALAVGGVSGAISLSRNREPLQRALAKDSPWTSVFVSTILWSMYYTFIRFYYSFDMITFVAAYAAALVVVAAPGIARLEFSREFSPK